MFHNIRFPCAQRWHEKNRETTVRPPTFLGVCLWWLRRAGSSKLMTLRPAHTINQEVCFRCQQSGKARVTGHKRTAVADLPGELVEGLHQGPDAVDVGVLPPVP